MKKNLALAYTIIAIILTAVIPLQRGVYANKYDINISDFVGEYLSAAVSKVKVSAGINAIYANLCVCRLGAKLMI
jgi:hypothetical protein